MQESTKSRLTTFSRLWAIPMILCIAFCIVGVFAVMNAQKNLIGIAAIGKTVMFLIMLCQLITSIIVRRWWCMVGVIIGLVLSIFVWFCSIAAMGAGQYRPQVPSGVDSTDISEIMLIIANQEDPGELLSSIKKAWGQYTSGEEYRGQFTMQDDYLMYVDREEEEGFVWTDTTEFRSWDFWEGSRKIVAMAHRDYLNGEISAGQFTGLSFYIYDGDTIEWASGYDLGIEYPEINGLVVSRLSGTDADITLTASNPEEGSCTKSFLWDGNKFIINK